RTNETASTRGTPAAAIRLTSSARAAGSSTSCSFWSPSRGPTSHTVTRTAPKLPLMVQLHPSASFSAIVRVRLHDHPGAVGQLATAIGEAGGLLDAIDLVRVEGGTKVRDVTVLAEDAGHLERIVAAIQELPGVEVDRVSDRVFLVHLGGKLEVQ